MIVVVIVIVIVKHTQDDYDSTWCQCNPCHCVLCWNALVWIHIVCTQITAQSCIFDCPLNVELMINKCVTRLRCHTLKSWRVYHNFSLRYNVVFSKIGMFLYKQKSAKRALSHVYRALHFVTHGKISIEILYKFMLIICVSQVHLLYVAFVL